MADDDEPHTLSTREKPVLLALALIVELVAGNLVRQREGHPFTSITIDATPIPYTRAG